MAISLSDILATIQNGVTALNGLSTQVKTTFPQRGEFSTAARGSLGGVTLNASQALGFMPSHKLRICRLCCNLSK